MLIQWMKNCFDLYDLYNHGDVMTIPTRPVSTVDAKQQLCFNSDFKECPEYVTLSHCRAKSHFITLKKDNVQQFREGIPDEALSKTFRDVIYITKELGIPHVWIDSICILCIFSQPTPYPCTP